MPFTAHADVNRILAALLMPINDAAVHRGHSYFRGGRVREVQKEADGTWRGWVQGSRAEPYEVRIRLGQTLEEGGHALRPVAFGACACPVGSGCKHMAAVLIDVAVNHPDWMPGIQSGRVPGLTPDLAEWISRLTLSVSLAQAIDEQREDLVPQVAYVLSRHPGRTLPVPLVSLRVLRRRPDGAWGKPVPAALTGPGNLLSVSLRPDDRQICRLLLATAGGSHAFRPESEFDLGGADGANLLRDLVASGRCFWEEVSDRPLQPGAPRPARACWRLDSDDRQKTDFQADPPADVVFAITPPWYVDARRRACGPLDTGWPAAFAAQWLSSPPVKEKHVGALEQVLKERWPQFAVPAPRHIEVEVVAGVPPVPRLVLRTQPEPLVIGRTVQCRVPVAALEFEYDGVPVAWGAGPAYAEDRRQMPFRRLPRDRAAEIAAALRLNQIGFHELDVASAPGARGRTRVFVPDDEQEWLHFLHRDLPVLREEHWHVVYDPSFALDVVEPDAWSAELAPAGNEWFDFDLGVEIEGRKVSLLPALMRVLHSAPGLLEREFLEGKADDDVVYLPLDEGRHVPFPVRRLRDIVAVLVDLHRGEGIEKGGPLRMHRFAAAALAAGAGEELQLKGGEALRDLGRRLRDVTGIREVAVPPTFHAVLRDYQHRGLDWLQFLREYRLAGILADDMGLGKTVQALAHLLLEKTEGRLDGPALVVAPTSLLPNWRSEAARFAPDLRVLVLHGLQRAAQFDDIPRHDLVVTSYALLVRDIDVLARHAFHLVLLDEAQFIKNPRTKAAVAAGRLQARHRLCMTGTPMENHLGELWSLFHFLLPGYLGNEAQFRTLFRTPIEKFGDARRHALLARRVGPFMLRRRKDEVVLELPPKTEIVRKLELEGRQRDLYEAIRLAMHERVRREVAGRGLASSQIIILDALLKLRQVCCDPRLVKLARAREVRESAKFEALFDMLPELLEEGRRVLLFSQFTSMLDLIIERLQAKAIPHVLLTGSTRDRETPVREFQAGRVPLFLISLKAGGTGLNLTAADTVIHYDPWWNPAVEQQATDRAHRIGQDKPVFVYKLVTEGTVEEKILALQERKRKLVADLVDREGAATPTFSPDDVEHLFAPLPQE